MKRTALPTIAGVINIIIGLLNLLGIIGVGIAIVFISDAAGVDVVVIPILWFVIVALLILCVPSLMGGIYALQRKKWAIALIGSIASFLIWNIIGLIPLILIIMSRDEFGTAISETSERIPLDSGKERYAKGEISREEFEHIKTDMT
ncbi:SHOCT domain-containing protein [Chloroflexota bacterium]